MDDKQKSEILDHPEVSDAVNKLTESGATKEVVDDVINSAINSIPGGTTRETVEMVSHCLLKKIREFESNHEAKTGAGQFIKKIFD